MNSKYVKTSPTLDEIVEEIKRDQYPTQTESPSNPLPEITIGQASPNTPNYEMS